MGLRGWGSAKRLKGKDLAELRGAMEMDWGERARHGDQVEDGGLQTGGMVACRYQLVK